MTTEQLITLRMNVFGPDPAVVVAQARGSLAAAGLDVPMDQTPDSTTQMRGLSDGTWQLASTAFDNVLAWSGRAGAEIVAVAQLGRAVELPVIGRPEIHDWEDLRGRPLAVDAVDTAFALVLRRVLLAHGLDLKAGDYSLVPVGATGPRLESMRRGETFAAILNPPFDARATAEGMVRLGDYRSVLPNYPGGVLAVARPWAEANRAALTRFLRVWLETAQWIEGHRDEAAELVVKARGISPEAARGLVADRLGTGDLNLDGLATALELRTTLGLAPAQGTDLARYYDTSFLEEARRPA